MPPCSDGDQVAMTCGLEHCQPGSLKLVCVGGICASVPPTHEHEACGAQRA